MTDNMTPSTPQAAPQMSTPQPRRGFSGPVVIGLVVVVAVIVFVMLQMTAGTSPTPENPAAQTQTEEMMMDENMEMNPGAATQGAQEEVVSEASAVAVEVEGGSYYYNPNVIRVKQGAQVTITLTSADMMHDFVIDELGIASAVVPAGRSTTVSFVADQVGEFEFYCSVSNHRAMGMVGTLIVEE